MNEQSVSASILSSFVPDLLSDRLGRGVALPWSESLTGTLLLSDICEFTTHVESANSRGAESIEAFNSGMRRYMDLHVDLIRSYGGDILDMAGDSFLCVWSSDGSDTQEVAAARSAAAAALAIQDRLQGFEVSPGSPIAVRIGIASGQIDLTIVGRSGQRCELLAAGAAIDAVAVAERDCAHGAVAVDPATQKLVGPDAEVSQLTAGLSQLDSLTGNDADQAEHRKVAEPDTIPTEVVAAQAPRIANSVGSKVDDWYPEFRRLSIVLALIPGIRDQSPTLVQDAVNSFHDIIGRYDGDGWATFDGKGSIFVATFGAPFAAHENDAERAVVAATELAAAINPITPISVGVATGRSLHGISGNAQRRAVTMAGEVVNVAARLAGSSDDRVLCDHETATAASGRFSFAVMNPILVKGKNERVSVFRPIDLVVEDAPSALAVRGRTEEFAWLERLTEDGRGEHRAIALIGESGMGKSTLVAEVLARAEAGGRPILIGRADSIGHSAPYSPWAGVIRQVLGLERASGSEPVIEAARQRLGPEQAPLAPLLGDVLGGSHDDEATASLSRERRVAATAGVIADLCCAAADPFLLVIEDAQWYDASSLVVLETVRQHPDCPRMILTARHRGSEIDHILDEETTETLELGLLEPGSVAEMIADRLGVDSVPAELSEFVFDRTNGHPFFCDELVKNLIEDGLVRAAGDKVSVGALDPTQVPSTIEGVVVSRFDRLPLDEQRCLKAAAVVGTVVEPAAVSASLGSDQHHHLDRLVQSGMLRYHQEQLEFSHVISRDIVYALMAGEQRVEIHRAVAEHLERVDHTNPGEVGYHWLNAGENERAVTFLTAAAESALRTGSFIDARSLFDQVAELRGEAGDGERAGAMIRINRAIASFYLGDMQGAITDLQAAVAVLDRPVPTDAPSRDHERRRSLLRRRGRSAPAPSTLDVDDQRALLDAYQRLGQLNYLTGVSPSEMQPTVLRSLELAQQLGDTNAEAWASAQLSAVSGMLGQTKQLRHHTDRAVGLVEAGRADQVATDVWRTVAVAYAGLGEWDAALSALDESAATQSQVGRQAGIWQTRAAIYLCAGDYINAEPEWRRAAEAGELIGNRVQVCWSRLDEIQTLIGRNRIEDAAAALKRIDGEFGEPSDPLGRIEYHYTAALVHSALGDAAAAHESAAVVMQMVESDPPSGFHWVEFCSGVVEVYLATMLADGADGSPPGPELVARIEHATSVLKGLSESFLHVASRVDLSLGLLAAGQGQSSRARRLMSRARTTAQRAHLDFDAARCTTLMESFADTPDLAELQRASEVFERLGAERWVARTANIVSGLPLNAVDS